MTESTIARLEKDYDSLSPHSSDTSFSDSSVSLPDLPDRPASTYSKTPSERKAIRDQKREQKAEERAVKKEERRRKREARALERKEKWNERIARKEEAQKEREGERKEFLNKVKDSTKGLRPDRSSKVPASDEHGEWTY